MAVNILYRGQVIEVPPGMPLRDVLIMNDIQPENHIAVRDSKIIDEDEVLLDGEVIRIVSIISGGA